MRRLLAGVLVVVSVSASSAEPSVTHVVRDDGCTVTTTRAEVDGRAVVTVVVTDLQGRLREKTMPDGIKTEYSTDQNGDITAIRRHGGGGDDRTWQFLYKDGKLVEVVDPRGKHVDLSGRQLHWDHGELKDESGRNVLAEVTG